MMQQDHTRQDNPPAYCQAPNRHISSLAQPINLPSFENIDSYQKDCTLPPLSFTHQEPRSFSSERPVWPSTNPLAAYYQPGILQLSPRSTKSSTGSPVVADTESPEFRPHRDGGILSIEDADVRLAAEALGDLRADFVGSPSQESQAILNPPRLALDKRSQEQEPLLSLLTTSHPLIGNAIGGSLSAYSASKNYSPRFKSSAEYVEKRFTPVVNTVGSVGRMTGVEGGVRWILGGRNPSQSSSQYNKCMESSNKRRKLDDDVDMDRNLEKDKKFEERRRHSEISITESLPAYDEMRCPRYELHQALIKPHSQQHSNSSGISWQSRLALSTSGLSIAMSEESLRSLKYCLVWLKWANGHIGKVITSLKVAIEQYDKRNRIGRSGEKDSQLILQSEAERHTLESKITELKKDVLKTLKEVVDIVSKYAGGALPENARTLVRRHLTSLPRRFRIASSLPVEISRKSDDADTKLTEGGRRILVLAKEGLDMMSQVSSVLDSTIVSAEDWCERLGRSKRVEIETESNDERPSEKPTLEPPRLESSEFSETTTNV